MSSKNLLWLVALALSGFARTASAVSGSPTLLYETPTSDVLAVGTMAISGDISFASSASATSWGREGNANVRFSPYPHLDLGVTAYTRADYVLDAKYQLVGDGSSRLGLAVGAYDLGINGYVSPIGHGPANAWPNWEYRANGVLIRPYESFSAFAVTSYGVTKSIRLHVGMGRGRFVGYGAHSKYLNTDILFGGHHQWAVGLFGGAEVFVIPQVAMVVEASGRDINTGVRADLGAFTVTAAWTRVEGMLFNEGTEQYGGLDFCLGYRFSDWSGIAGLLGLRRTARNPGESALPPPEEGIALQGTTARPDQFSLEPVMFDWDSWAITRTAAASLSRDARMLRDYPQDTVLVTGHASEEGSPEANFVLSGKRAFAVYEQLRGLGVPARRMRYLAEADATGRPSLLQRVVCLDVESGYRKAQ